MTDPNLHLAEYNFGTQRFDALGNGNLVLWWVPQGTRPTEAEGIARWRHWETHGDTDHAFGWSYLKEAQAWRAKACDSMAAE